MITTESQNIIPSKFSVRHEAFMHLWWEVTLHQGSLYIQQDSACLLPLAGGPDVGSKVTPTKTQWEEAYRLVSSFKLNGIRGDKDILDGTQIGWDVLWGDVKSKRTIVNPVGDTIGKLYEAVNLVTVSKEFPNGIVDADCLG